MDQVEEIKNKTDIVELISQYMPLKKAGRNFKGLCPFHGEKTPSFMVNPELQIWKCFGCSLGGDVYTFLQKMEGMEFGEALKKLADRAGVKLVSYKPTEREELKDRLIGINSLAGDVYHYLLTKHKLGEKALEYVKGRGITGEAIERFRIGYAPDAWDFMFNFLIGKKKMAVDNVRRTGLVVEGKNYDRFRNRVMFPLNNSRGQVMGFAGRQMPGSDEKSGGKYVNTPETEIYHKSELLYGLDITRSEIKQAGWAVVVEGEIDAIASWQGGVKNVVAIKGSALTERQVELMRRLVDTIVLGLDADTAGDAAARRGIEMADKAGLMVKMAKWEGGKDPGDIAIAAPARWQKIVKEAIVVYDFYIQSAVGRYGLGVDGKKKIGQELLPILANVSDEIVKAHYVVKLAETLGVGEEDIRAQMEKIRNPKSEIIDKPQSQGIKSRREILEEYIVELAIKGKKIGELPELVSDFWRRVGEELRKDGDVRKLPAELRGRVEDLVLKDGEWEEKEWETALMELEEVDVREKIGGGQGDVRRLSKRLSELTKDK